MAEQLFDLLDVTEDVAETLTEKAESKTVRLHVVTENACTPGVTDCIGDGEEVKKRLKKIMEDAINETEKCHTHHIYIKVCGNSMDNYYARVLVKNRDAGFAKGIITYHGAIVRTKNINWEMAL